MVGDETEKKKFSSTKIWLWEIRNKSRYFRNNSLHKFNIIIDPSNTKFSV